MTFVAKVLVVVQFALSICFMAFAGAVYTAQTNWRTQAEDLKKDVARINQERSAEVAEAEKSKAEAAQQVARLTEDRDLLTGKLRAASDSAKRLQTELESARTAVDQQTAVANLAAEQAKFRQEETLRQRERNESMHQQVNTLLAKARQLEDDVFAKTLSIESMRERHDQVLAELASVRQRLQNIGMSSGSPSETVAAVDGSAPPVVRGRVLETRESPTSQSEYVLISLGSDDGFSKGNELVVYRADTYLGKIELTDIYPDRAVGRVIPSSRPRNGVIQKGDNVTPQI